jgi:DNA invertase Pin-like site-specific DNA recombinase
MSLYGYARVSTFDQELSVQRAALEIAGCEVIRAEKASGTRRDGRTELQVLLDFVRAGDTLVVTRIDRLARSLKDLQDIVHELKAKDVALRATEQPVNTGTAAGKAFLDMLGVFAEFETNLRRERQLEGISAAKARGVYKGRKPAIDAVEVLRLRRDEKLGPAAIARRLGIGRASVYRLLGKPAAVSAKGGWRCRSGLRCGGFIPAIGERSAGACGSSAAPACARDAAGRTARQFAVCPTALVRCHGPHLAQRPRPAGALARSRRNAADAANPRGAGRGAPRPQPAQQPGAQSEEPVPALPHDP